MKTRSLLREMLRDDVGRGDITSSALIKPEVWVRGLIIAKQSGILAGVKEAQIIFREVGGRAKPLKREGKFVRPGTPVLEVTGRARSVLSAERIALNLLMRMSGIATTTHQLVRLAKSKNPKIIIAATRKTAPLLTRFDKRAVVLGGGNPHRRGLSDQILIKRNHVKIVGSIERAVELAKRKGKRPIEIEVSSPEEALRAGKADADIIMLDNLEPREVKRVVELLKREGLRKKVVLEASGGITPENIQQYAAMGVDIISTSYMTMRAQALDMGLELVEVRFPKKSRK